MPTQGQSEDCRARPGLNILVGFLLSRTCPELGSPPAESGIPCPLRSPTPRARLEAQPLIFWAAMWNHHFARSFSQEKLATWHRQVAHDITNRHAHLALPWLAAWLALGRPRVRTADGKSKRCHGRPGALPNFQKH